MAEEEELRFVSARVGYFRRALKVAGHTRRRRV